MKKVFVLLSLLMLHGAGGRGDDNRKQLVDAGGGAAMDKMGVSGKFGAYVMAGRCLMADGPGVPGYAGRSGCHIEDTKYIARLAGPRG